MTVGVQCTRLTKLLLTVVDQQSRLQSGNWFLTTNTLDGLLSMLALDTTNPFLSFTKVTATDICLASATRMRNQGHSVTFTPRKCMEKRAGDLRPGALN